MMDRIRTPYRRRAWLDPECTFPVVLRWYPCPPDAKPFPGYHKFSSGDWSEQAFWQSWPGPGEDKDDKRRFIAGDGPRFQYNGQGGYEGNQAWFVEGVPLKVILAALANPPARTCTGFRPPLFVGGFSSGGSSLATFYPGSPPVRITGGDSEGGEVLATFYPGAATTSLQGGSKQGGEIVQHPYPTLSIVQGGTRQGGLTVVSDYPGFFVAVVGGTRQGGSIVPVYPPSALVVGGDESGGSMPYRDQGWPCNDTGCCGDLLTDGPPLHAKVTAASGGCACLLGFEFDLTWTTLYLWESGFINSPCTDLPETWSVFCSPSSEVPAWNLTVGTDVSVEWDTELSSCYPFKLVFHASPFPASPTCSSGGSFTLEVTLA